MRHLPLIFLIVNGLAIVHADEIVWVEIEHATIAQREVTLDRGTVHGIVVEGLTRSTLRDELGAIHSRLIQPANAQKIVAPKVPLPHSASHWPSVSAHLARQGYSDWSVGLGWPEPRYLNDQDGLTLALVHRVRIGRTIPPTDEREIFVDAYTGAVLNDRSILRHVEAGGVILGRLPENDLPYSPSATFVDRPLSGLTVFSPQAGDVLTNIDGEFAFDLPVGTSTFFTAALDGPLLTVFDQSGAGAAYLGLASTIGPPVEVIFNQIPNEFSTAEVSSFSIVTRARDWIYDLSPGFGPISAPVTINVNYTGSCFAFYSPIFSSMNFAQSSIGCANTAYGSVIAHEYYHHLQNQVVAVTPPYAEAMADTFAAYLLDSPLIGEDFGGPGTELRSLAEPHQFPNPSSNPVEEGLPLAAAFWSLRNEFQATLGAVDGARYAAEIWLASQLLGTDTVDSQIVSDLILLDDDDGDFANGSPNAPIIIEAFTAHGFDAPVFPVSGVACEVMENQVLVTWDLPSSTDYDHIIMIRNGTPLSTLAGTSTNYLDAFPPAGSNLYTVSGVWGSASSPPALCVAEVEPYTDFIRGDANRDGEVQLNDAVELLSILFFQKVEGYGCDDSLDANDNGSLQITDAIVLLDYLFLLGPVLPAPFPASGYDPTPDDLRCK